MRNAFPAVDQPHAVVSAHPQNNLPHLLQHGRISVYAVELLQDLVDGGYAQFTPRRPLAT